MTKEISQSAFAIFNDSFFVLDHDKKEDSITYAVGSIYTAIILKVECPTAIKEYLKRVEQLTIDLSIDPKKNSSFLCTKKEFAEILIDYYQSLIDHSLKSET